MMNLVYCVLKRSYIDVNFVEMVKDYLSRDDAIALCIGHSQANPDRSFYFTYALQVIPD